MLYSGILFIVYLFPPIGAVYFLFTGQPNYVLLVLGYMFHPLQGFFNVLVYLIPSFQRRARREQGGNNRGSIWVIGERIARFRQSIRSSIVNSFMTGTRKNDDQEERNVSQIVDDHDMEKEQTNDEQGDNGRDIKFPVTEFPELTELTNGTEAIRELMNEETMEMNALCDNKPKSNDAMKAENEWSFCDEQKQNIEKDGLEGIQLIRKID